MRSCIVWIKMVFDFIKRLFGLLDETPRKRRAEHLDNDYESTFVSPKKYCCGVDRAANFGQVVIYADENDEEDVQFIGETHYSPLRTKERLNGTSCSKRKLSSTFERTSERCNKPIAKMNGKNPKANRFAAKNTSTMSTVDCANLTLSKTNQLRDKHAYSKLLQNFLPSRTQLFRSKPQEDDSKKRIVTEVIDVEKFQIPSTSIQTPQRGSWTKSNDVFYTPHSSTPLKFYTPREVKSKTKDDDLTILSTRRNLNAPSKDEDVSIISPRKSLNDKSASTSRVIPIIKVDSAEDSSPVVSPQRPQASKIERMPMEIIPTNTLRDTLSAKAVMKQDFVPRVYGNYNERKEQHMKEVEELKRITCLMSKNNRLTREAALEVQLARSMRLCEAVLDETEEFDDDALPTLTPAMQQEIKNALVPHPPNEILVESFGLRITRKDIHTLYGLNWLNDEVINFYMNLLIARGNGTNDKYPRIHAMNTFFYPKLLSGGHSSLKRWTRKIDIFAQDLLVVPIHLGIHWCMSIIDFRDKTIKYFDSMGGSNPKCLTTLRQYLEDESMDKKKKPFDTNDWKLISMKDIPQQMNGSDCGVFSCMFAEFITADRKITFTQQDMPYFREKMVYEILKAKLL